MPSYHHQVSAGKKGSGLSHALYVARKGRYRGRDDLVILEYGNFPSWANGDPFLFWKEGDNYERSNGAVYREHEIALPGELDAGQKRELVHQLIQEFAGDAPYLAALHGSKSSSIEGLENDHLHLITSDRVPDGIERTAELFHKRPNALHPELGGVRKRSGGKTPWQLGAELVQVKKRSAELQNEALMKAGIEARVDHRSLKQQGISRQPERHQGQARVRTMSVDEKKVFVDARHVQRSA